MTSWRAVSVPTQKSNGDLPRESGLTASPGRTGTEAAQHGAVMPGRSSGRKPNTAGISTGAGGFFTADSAALDIVGDIDLAIVYEPAAGWGLQGVLLTKFDAVFGGLKSYEIQVLASKVIEIRWSVDGAAELAMVSDTAIPEPREGSPLGVRAQLDVDSGGGNRTATFLTSLDLGVTWQQLGNPVTTAGVTSINAGTANLMVGEASGGFVAAAGVFYEAWVRNGIDGPLVANPRFRDQPPRQPSFRDDQGNVWSMNGTAFIGVVG